MSILIGVCGMDLSPWKTTPNSNQFADFFLFIILSQDSRENKKKFLDSSQGRSMVETGSYFI